MTYRNVNRSLGQAFDEPAILSTKNFMSDGLMSGTGLKLKPSNSTSATQMIGTLTEMQSKRQNIDVRGKTMQTGSKTTLEHR